MHVWQPGNLCERLTQRLFWCLRCMQPSAALQGRAGRQSFCAAGAMPCWEADPSSAIVIILLWRHTEMHWGRSSAYDQLHLYSQIHLCALAGYYNPLAEAYAHGRQGLPPPGGRAAATKTQCMAHERMAAPHAAAVSSNKALTVCSCCIVALNAMIQATHRCAAVDVMHPSG